MIGIIVNASKWIVKDAHRLFKAHEVLREVGGGFVVIPLKSNSFIEKRTYHGVGTKRRETAQHENAQPLIRPRHSLRDLLLRLVLFRLSLVDEDAFAEGADVEAVGVEGVEGYRRHLSGA